MEQKTKIYSELNRYEKAMTNAALEQRLEAMANGLKQMALALGISVSIDATFHNWGEGSHTSVNVSFIDDGVTSREMKETGDLFGIIEEALNKPASVD